MNKPINFFEWESFPVEFVKPHLYNGIPCLKFNCEILLEQSGTYFKVHFRERDVPYFPAFYSKEIIVNDSIISIRANHWCNDFIPFRTFSIDDEYHHTLKYINVYIMESNLLLIGSTVN